MTSQSTDSLPLYNLVSFYLLTNYISLGLSHSHSQAGFQVIAGMEKGETEVQKAAPSALVRSLGNFRHVGRETWNQKKRGAELDLLWGSKRE